LCHNLPVAETAAKLYEFFIKKTDPLKYFSVKIASYISFLRVET
jgi:hypothetical protein